MKNRARATLLAILIVGASLTGFYFFRPIAAPIPTPAFNADTAYEQILKYESFGPKVPGNAAHQAAGDWILSELKLLTATVHEQKAQMGNVPVRNFIAQFNPAAKKRILLSAHWDNRPHADEDEGNNAKSPVPGVNDGGSGVVVLLQIGAAIAPLYNDTHASNSSAKPDFGVDLAFWDAEDGGQPSHPESYCLGSQYFAKNPIPAGYKPIYGINFDMVGRTGSRFPIDRFSEEHAGEVLKKFRDTARSLGYQDLFPSYRIGPVVDDHVFLSKGLNFPMIDLIYMNEDGTFAPEWHTVRDTSAHISREVLKVVGQTTLQLLFSAP
jgi:hypothetical protein